jgi:lysophospholipase L1-like esterase
VDGRNTVQDILNRHPQSERFLILYGTNDAGALPAVPSGLVESEYVGSFKDNMQQIIDAVNQAGKEACIAEVPVQLADCSTCDWYENPSEGARNEIVREYNEVIDELKSDPGNNINVEPPDFYTYYLNHYEQEYANWLHPNGLGYRSMADLWRQALTQ